MRRILFWTWCLTAIPALLGGQTVKNFVTIYNNNLALVRQVREVSLDPATPVLTMTDVAEKLIPTSVLLKPLSGKVAFQVLEQNFEYDLASAEKILQKYIDHPVKLTTADGNLIEGTLLSLSGGQLVLQTRSELKILRLSDNLQISVQELPEGLRTRPTLIWLYSIPKKKTLPVELSYLTEGMSWHAEYIGVLNASETRMETAAWVSIENRSGATFHDAQIKLVAGEIHRARQRPIVPYTERAVVSARQQEAPFKEKAFFEYHLYTLQRPSTLGNRQIKQISLFPTTTVSVQKVYLYDARRERERVLVNVEFKNDRASGLGMPLPEGVFRLYKRDGEAVEFIGEDWIDHTPRNETLSLTVGKAFDVVAQRQVVAQSRPSKRAEEQTIEIEFRNTKKEAIEILVREHFPPYRSWEIKESNLPFKKRSATEVEFRVPVGIEQTNTLRYRVLYWW